MEIIEKKTKCIMRFDSIYCKDIAKPNSIFCSDFCQDEYERQKQVRMCKVCGL